MQEILLQDTVRWGAGYHLKTVRKSQDEKSYTTIEFSDSEYIQFTKALLQDIANTIMLGG